MAGRDASAKVQNAIAPHLPWLRRRFGRPRPVDEDAASPSTAPATFEAADTYAGRNFHFGIREHAMGADRCNGMSLSRSLRARSAPAFLDLLRLSCGRRSASRR
jgi:transketolase